MWSRKELEALAVKINRENDTGKETKNEHVSTKNESEQTPKEKKVVEEDKEEPYVPPPSYKPLICSLKDRESKNWETIQKKLSSYINIPFTEFIT